MHESRPEAALAVLPPCAWRPRRRCRRRRPPAGPARTPGRSRFCRPGRRGRRAVVVAGVGAFAHGHRPSMCTSSGRNATYRARLPRSGRSLRPAEPPASPRLWFAAPPAAARANLETSTTVCLCGNDSGPRTRAFSVGSQPRASYKQQRLRWTPQGAGKLVDSRGALSRCESSAKRPSSSGLALPQALLLLAASRTRRTPGLPRRTQPSLNGRSPGSRAWPCWRRETEGRDDDGRQRRSAHLVESMRFRVSGWRESCPPKERCGPSLGSQRVMMRRGPTHPRPRPPGHRGEGVREVNDSACQKRRHQQFVRRNNACCRDRSHVGVGTKSSRSHVLILA